MKANWLPPVGAEAKQVGVGWSAFFQYHHNALAHRARNQTTKSEADIGWIIAEKCRNR